jgi:hypothetical protein
MRDRRGEYDPSKRQPVFLKPVVHQRIVRIQAAIHLAEIKGGGRATASLNTVVETMLNLSQIEKKLELTFAEIVKPPRGNPPFIRKDLENADADDETAAT